MEWFGEVVDLSGALRDGMGTRESYARGLVALAMLLLVVPVWSVFLVEESALTVTSPESLQGTHQSAIGNFGIPQYGGTLSGTVMYPSVNAKACEKFSIDQFKTLAGQRPIFALVDRGGNVTIPCRDICRI